LDNNYYPMVMPFGEGENGLWFGYQDLRADLDEILLDRARLDVIILQPYRAIVEYSTGQIER
jgi:hypothetical protein